MLGHAGKRLVALAVKEQRYEIEAHGHDGDYQLRHGEATGEVTGARLDDEALSARFDGAARRAAGDRGRASRHRP